MVVFSGGLSSFHPALPRRFLAVTRAASSRKRACTSHRLRNPSRRVHWPTGRWTRLDPHGLWSASPDAPVAALLRKHQGELVRELEAPIDAGSCRIAEEAGAALAGWVRTLGTTFDESVNRSKPASLEEAWRTASRPAFEDRVVAKPARQLADELGRAMGVIGRSFGDGALPFVRAARERFLPPLSAEGWSEAVLAAAVRAYLPQIDPHGGWAPLDEETSLYEVDLEVSPPARLWDHMVRTAIGMRVESGAPEPLLPRDLVLQVGDVPTAGLSVEQAEQLAILDGGSDDATVSRSLIVLREGERTPRTLSVAIPADRERDVDGDDGLPSERVPYGDGDALVVTIADVPDDLGDLLATIVSRAKREKAPLGIVLDLRGNGGGFDRRGQRRARAFSAGRAALSHAPSRWAHRNRARTRASGHGPLAGAGGGGGGRRHRERGRDDCRRAGELPERRRRGRAHLRQRLRPGVPR